MDELPLGKWHVFVMLALGLVWIFDGYEVTLISIYRPQIEQNHSVAVFKSLVSAYQIGGMVGSLIFGLLAFIVGRRRIFLVKHILHLDHSGLILLRGSLLGSIDASYRLRYGQIRDWSQV